MYSCISCKKEEKNNIGEKQEEKNNIDERQEENEKCMFSGESQYDIKEILRLNNLIFEKKGLKVCFIDGGLGAGKTYKVERALGYQQIMNNNINSVTFESFQTGYNDNFIYILFLELLKKDRSKHIDVFLNNVGSISNIILTIPVILSLIILFSTVLKGFDFSKQEIISVNPGYTILIIITIVISLFILPYALTFRKEYTILNRDYYYELVTKLLPEVLIIDDFERLTENQRRQIYEFINFLRGNEKKEKKVETKLNRILILGDLKAVENMESLYKSETKERITNESFVTKYYDQRIILGGWIETFTEKYTTDYPEKPLNAAEMDHITKILNYFSPILSRREFVMFMNNKKFNFQEESFEQALVNEIKSTKRFEFDENLRINSNTRIETGKGMNEDFMKLVNRDIPLNKTLYTAEGKLNLNRSLAEVIEIYKNLKIDNLNLLLASIEENAGNKTKNINFFKTEQMVKKFKDFQERKRNLPQTRFDYIYKDNFNDFFEANEQKLSSRFRGDTIYKALLENEDGDKSHLQMLADKYIGKKTIILDPISEFSGYNSYKHHFSQNANDDSGYSLEEFNKEFKSNVDEFINFKENIVFEIIEKYKNQFDLEDAKIALKIAESTSGIKILEELSRYTDVEKSIKFLEERKDDSQLVQQKIAVLIMGFCKRTTCEINELYPWISNENLASVQHIIRDIKELSLDDEKKALYKYEFIDLKTILELNRELVDTSFLEYMVRYHKNKESDISFLVNEIIRVGDNGEIINNELLSPVQSFDLLSYLEDPDDRYELLSWISEEQFELVEREFYGEFLLIILSSTNMGRWNIGLEIGDYIVSQIFKEVTMGTYVSDEDFVIAVEYAIEKHIKLPQTKQFRILASKYYVYNIEENTVIDNVYGHEYDKDEVLPIIELME